MSMYLCIYLPVHLQIDRCTFDLAICLQVVQYRLGHVLMTISSHVYKHNMYIVCIYIYMFVFICMCVSMYICKYVCVCIYLCICVCDYTSLHAHMYMHKQDTDRQTGAQTGKHQADRHIYSCRGFGSEPGVGGCKKKRVQLCNPFPHPAFPTQPAQAKAEHASNLENS